MSRWSQIVCIVYFFFTVQGIALAADSDGDLTAAAGVTEPVDLGTTIDTTGEAIDLFDITLVDGGSGDALPLLVSEIVVHVSGTSSDAERGQITWRLSHSKDPG